MNLRRNKKKIKINKKTYAQTIKGKMGKYYEAKPFKILAKRKKDSYREILGVINKKNENFKIKKTKQNKKTQTVTGE